MAESSKSAMKVVQLHKYGGPEVLKYEDAPRPQPKEGELLLRVMATAVNPVDAKIREGAFREPGAPEVPMPPAAGGGEDLRHA